MIDSSRASQELPLAEEWRETEAKNLFELDVSPDEYAARNAHRWMSFSFDDYRYRDPVLHAWIHRLGDILFGRPGAPSVERLREELLSPEERQLIANELSNGVE